MDKGTCIKLPARSAVTKKKYLLNQMEADLFIAETVTEKEKDRR